MQINFPGHLAAWGLTPVKTGQYQIEELPAPNKPDKQEENEEETEEEIEEVIQYGFYGS